MTAGELREMNVEDLTRKISELKENLFNLKLRLAARTLDSSADVKNERRNLARALTVLTQKQGFNQKQKVS